LKSQCDQVDFSAFFINTSEKSWLQFGRVNS